MDRRDIAFFIKLILYYGTFIIGSNSGNWPIVFVSKYDGKLYYRKSKNIQGKSSKYCIENVCVGCVW